MDDLYRAIQYLDEDACGSRVGSSFIPEELANTDSQGARRSCPNKNCIVACRVTLFTSGISKIVAVYRV